MTKILVVEDNAANLYLIDYILSHAGYNVIHAVTGEDGVEQALNERPHLILMDIRLPGIDGLEATRRIRCAQAGKDMPIVAFTSYAMTGDRELALAAGCTGYLEKPIVPESFLGSVKAYL